MCHDTHTEKYSYEKEIPASFTELAIKSWSGGGSVEDILSPKICLKYGCDINLAMVIHKDASSKGVGRS